MTYSFYYYYHLCIEIISLGWGKRGGGGGWGVEEGGKEVLFRKDSLHLLKLQIYIYMDVTCFVDLP